ncbi:MAG TPA: 30S ribosomal protein S5 [Candidatus Paceibacterota bacterium]|nr:30S ribosomal protein S5 [Candidatus Paceibacterota bacterium]
MNDTPTPTPIAPTPPTGPALDEQGTQRPLRGGRFGMRGSRGGRPGRGPRSRGPMEKPEFDQKTLALDRVVRVTKGGKRFSFRATVVAGNGKGRVGVGIAKGHDVQQSIQKAYHQAKRHLITVTIKGGTIPYQVEGKYSSAKVILKPSRSGIKAGGAVRVVAQLAGIGALTGKLISRTSNKLNIARAAIQALESIRPITE